MNNVIDYLPPHIKDYVVCIYKTGSQLFCTKCKDADYVILTNTNIGYLHYIYELKADCFLMSVEDFKKALTDDKWRYKLSACMAYANSKNVVYGSLPFLPIDILSRYYLINTILPVEYEYAEKTYFKKQPLKTSEWGFALYYAILNGNFIFTAEQKEVLQKAHDLELNVDNCVELKNNFLKLLNNEAT